MAVIAHLSDLHFGRHDPAAVEALLADLAANPPDILVNSGDSTQRSRRWQWALASDFLQRLPGQRICVPGNHDIPLFNLVARFLSPLAGFRRHLTADEFPSCTSPSVAILGVNTARPLILNPLGFWKDGSFSDAQLEEIPRFFAGIDDGAMRILVAHHPLIPPLRDKPRHHIVWRAAEALNVMGRCGVDVVLSGHLHLSYRRVANASGRDLLCIQASTAVSGRRRHGHRNAYNRITVHSRSELSLEVRDFNGRAFEQSAAEKWQRNGNCWSLAGS
jgi:3',5'-cyclic AMP phosphodiesterase CpdA